MMKIAVCISGICRGDVSRNINALKNRFPTADFFYGTWKGREEGMANIPGKPKFFTFDEPEMHYHPLTDQEPDFIKNYGPKINSQYKQFRLKPKMIERTKHHTKQILAHAYMLQEIDPSYDMIVRARFDTWVTPQVNFNPCLIDSYEMKRSIGFGVRGSRHRDINKLKDVPKVYPDENYTGSQDWGWYLMDPLIMHRRDTFDIDYALQLHRDKKLLPAEWGWYQVLSEPFGDNHRSIYGGAQIEKYL